jgi:hypothetical protein
MPDIFNKTTNKLGGAWSADGAAVSFSGQAAGLLGVGMIVQQVNIGYQQQVTRLYEIGSDLTYYVAGRVQGNMTVGRIVGPGVVMSAFYARFGDVCNAAQNTMNLYIGTGCRSTGGTTATFMNARFTISYAVLINVGISVGAMDMVINEQLQMMFISMSTDSATGTGTGTTTPTAPGTGGAGIPNAAAGGIVAA